MNLEKKDVRTVTFVDASPFLICVFLVCAIWSAYAQVTKAINPHVPGLPEVTGATRTAIGQFYAPTPTIDDQIAEVINDELDRIEREMMDDCGHFQLDMMVDPIYGSRATY